MIFPPLKPDRCLVWISLVPDETVVTRYAALREVLRACRLHPLDTTPGGEVVIVDQAAFDAQVDAVRAVLGPGDLLHRISARGDRLAVDVVAGAEAEGDRLPERPAVRRPPWQR
ncbi:MAG: hypothetical protein Kow0077_23490 [Anaerolineae bacterium]